MVRLIRSLLLVALVMIAIFVLLALPKSPVILAQVRISDTPVAVILPEATQPPTLAVFLTATPTFTPTAALPSVFLEGALPPSELNVRDFPENGAYLGSLVPGQRYPITGVYFSWLQFEYPAGVDGKGWIYAPTVRVFGNVNEVAQIDPNAVLIVVENDETATAAARFLIPGVAETATAEARILVVPTLDPADGSLSGFPPTFTAPAEIVARVPTQQPDNTLSPTPQPDVLEQAVGVVVQRSLPPITSILVLGGLGVLGIAIGLLRRR